MSVTLHTSHGDIHVALYTDRCPETCYSFIALAASGYFDNVPFYRVVPKGIAQWGVKGGKCAQYQVAQARKRQREEKKEKGEHEKGKADDEKLGEVDDEVGIGAGQAHEWATGKYLPDEICAEGGGTTETSSSSHRSSSAMPLLHDKRGKLAMASKPGKPNSSATEFYFVLNPAVTSPQLDGKDTVFGCCCYCDLNKLNNTARPSSRPAAPAPAPAGDGAGAGAGGLNSGVNGSNEWSAASMATLNAIERAAAKAAKSTGGPAAEPVAMVQSVTIHRNPFADQ